MEYQLLNRIYTQVTSRVKLSLTLTFQKDLFAYEAAVKEAMNEPADGATTLKKKAAEKLAAKTAPAAEEAAAPVTESTTSVEVGATTTVEEVSTPVAQDAADSASADSGAEQSTQA